MSTANEDEFWEQVSESERLRERLDRTSLYARNIPKDVKKQFKAWCVDQGLTMNEAIVLLMKEACKRRNKNGLS